MTKDEERDRHFINSMTMQTKMNEIDAKEAPATKFNATIDGKQIIICKTYNTYRIRTRGWKPTGRYPIKNGFYELETAKTLIKAEERFYKHLKNMINEEIAWIIEFSLSEESERTRKIKLAREAMD